MKKRYEKRLFTVCVCVSLVLTVFFSQAQFVPVLKVPSVKAQEEEGWINRYVYKKENSMTFNLGPQVFWDGSDWQELEFIKNDTYPYFITWASVENCSYFVRNSHIALEITNNSYVKLWNPDYTRVSVYTEQWTVEYWKANKWKDTGVGFQPNSWSVSQTDDCVNITRIQSLIGVGELNVTYTVRKGCLLKHEVVFKNVGSTTYEYRAVMSWAGITSAKYKTEDEEFTVSGEKHKVTSWFRSGENDNNLVLSEYLDSLGTYNETGQWNSDKLKDIVFDTHAEGSKADIIIGNYTLGQSERLEIDPTTDTFTLTVDDEDGHVWATDGDYSVAQGANTGTAISTSNSVGQSKNLGLFYIYRMFLRFDTQSLPDDATITGATLKLYGANDYSDTNFVIRIQGWTGAPEIADADYNDFDGTSYDDGNFNTGSFSTNAYNDIVFSAYTIIDKTGATDLCIRSAEDIAVSENSQNEFVEVEDASDSNPPKLEVTYSTGGDEEAPTYSNTGHNNTLIGQPTNFYSYWQDNVELDDCVFSTNNTGSWVNDTLWENAGVSSKWGNKTVTLNDTSGTVVQYKWYCSDTATPANWNTTSIHSLTTTSPASTVTLNSPSNNAKIENRSKVDFKYTPIFYTAIQNSSLYTNYTGTWTKTQANTTTVTNNTENIITYIFGGDGVYIWNVGVHNSTQEIFATANFTLTIETFYNFVDNNTSDEDSSADKGTHSDFESEKTVNGMDTLTEADAGGGSESETLYVDGFDSTYTEWTESGDSPYLNNTDTGYVYTKTDGYKEGEWSFANSGWGSGTISSVYLYLELKGSSARNDYVEVFLYDGVGWTEEPNHDPDNNDYAWASFDVSTKFDSWTKIDAAEMYLVHQRSGSPRTVEIYVRRAYLNVTRSATNYNLDLEEQWTDANYTRANEELCIKTGTFSGSENLQVKVRSGASWVWLMNLTASQWNNVSVSTYLTTSTFTIQFLGGTETSDTTQDTWQKDCALLHTWEAAAEGPTNDACASTTTFTVNVDGWVNMTVTDTGGTNDFKEVKINVTTTDSKYFILNWTESTHAFAEVTDGDNICTFNTGSSLNETVDSDTWKICFLFKISVAAQKGACNVEATSTDDSDNTDTDTYTSEFSINFYSSITVTTTTHSWSADPGQSNVTVAEGTINITVTANADFNVQAKGDGDLTYNSYTIPVGNVLMHKDTLASSINLTTSYQNVPGLTSQAWGSSLEKTFVLWLTVPDGKPAGSYTYVLYIKITEA